MDDVNSGGRREQNDSARKTGPRYLTIADKFLIDILTFLLSYFAAFFIAFEGIPDPAHLKRLFLLLPGVILARILCFRLLSVYSIVWKYVSVIDAARILTAILPVTAGLLLGRILLPARLSVFRLPLSFISSEFLLALVGTLGARLTRRVAYELSGRGGPEKKRTLLIGAGGAGNKLIGELGRRVYSGMEVVGFVDDNPDKLGTALQGFKVLGSTAQIPEIVKKLDIEEAIITIANLPSKDIGRIIDVCKGTKIKVRVFHSLFELLLDDSGIPDVLATDPEAAAQEQLQIFRALTGRDYDPAAEARYPVNHIYEVNKPFSDPEGLSGHLLVATGTMIKLLHLAPGASVLDLGCGCGWTSIMLARCGFRVTGLDMNAASLEIGRRNAEALGIPVKFINADMQRFTVDQLFDAVVIFDSLHHCLREHSVLSGAESALAPGGKILLCEQNYPDEDRAGILTHEAAIQAMRQHGTLEKGLGTRYLVRGLFECGLEMATVFTTQSHYRTWLVARKPRPGQAAARSIIYTSDFDVALRQYA
jgi:2-polyprenyl-3-methyl-5-hydroxy-6-metoxy-1,4-benzoquinol methylase